MHINRKISGFGEFAAATPPAWCYVSNLYWFFFLFSSCQVRSSGIPSECLDYNAPEHNPTGAHLSLFGCHGQGGNQVHEAFHTSSSVALYLSHPETRSHLNLATSLWPVGSRTWKKKVIAIHSPLKWADRSRFSPGNCSLIFCPASNTCQHKKHCAIESAVLLNWMPASTSDRHCTDQQIVCLRGSIFNVAVK